MTTQELKDYIGRVLGNGIRCILPSYWWKRLFGLVADRVDEVEGSIVTSIDEFAKNRPDIEDRTFYMSEDADLVAHNVNTFARWYAELGSMKVKPFYIATPFSDTGDTVIWWIRSDGFEGTGYGPAFRNVIIGEKKYNVMFLSGGSYFSQEVPSDSITVDTEMSDTSENAVQNKVITEAMKNKVDKVEGKQLSTEDFTTALKTKLEGLNAFDPTEINNKVNGLQSQFDTLVSGDASTAIESFNEIVAFLNGVQDTESLDGIIAGIEQQIASVQSAIPTKTSQLTNDSGFLTSHQDISHLATKDELNSLDERVTALEGEKEGGSSVTVDTELSETSENAVSNSAVTRAIVANEEVTAAALNELNERVNAISENVSGETATKVELQTAVESLTNTILENEEITAAALNDLNSRLNEILTRLTKAGI